MFAFAVYIESVMSFESLFRSTYLHGDFVVEEVGFGFGFGYCCRAPEQSRSCGCSRSWACWKSVEEERL